MALLLLTTLEQNLQLGDCNRIKLSKAISASDTSYNIELLYDIS